MAATHTPRAIMPITRGEAMLLGIVTALALGIALFPWFPAQSSVAAGIRAPWTLTAPRAISYDSDARTEQVRSEAADAVPDVLVLDPAIREQALTELDRQFARIAQLRSDTSVATATREIAIQAIANTLAEPSAAALANASEAEWDIVRAEARAALGCDQALMVDHDQARLFALLAQARQTAPGARFDLRKRAALAIVGENR